MGIWFYEFSVNRCCLLVGMRGHAEILSSEFRRISVVFICDTFIYIYMACLYNPCGCRLLVVSVLFMCCCHVVSVVVF